MATKTVRFQYKGTGPKKMFTNYGGSGWSGVICVGERGRALPKPTIKPTQRMRKRTR